MTTTNTSATGGILCPTPAMGLDQEDEDVQGLDEGLLDGSIHVTGKLLNRFLTVYFAALACMDSKLFRPRWQPEPPNLPTDAKGNAADWCALGITKRKADTFAYEGHNKEGDGFDEVIRNEELEILVSFYGPNSDANADRLRDGFQLAQNRELLAKNEMGLIETGDITIVPALVKERWLYRADMTVYIRRAITRGYGVLNLKSAEVELVVEGTSTRTIDINPGA